MPPHRSHPSNDRRPRRRRLAAIAIAVAAVWLIILPLAARTPAIRAHIRRNEAFGVDPSAKFYSELPVMPELWQRLKQVRRDQRHPSS